MACLSSSDRHPYYPALLAASALLAGLAVPPTAWAALPDLCLFHRCFGLPCPTCGLTRSWSALLHGQVAAAFRFHLLGPAALAGVVGWAALRLPRTPLRLQVHGRAWIAVPALVWLAYALARITGWLAGPPGS